MGENKYLSNTPKVIVTFVTPNTNLWLLNIKLLFVSFLPELCNHGQCTFQLRKWRLNEFSPNENTKTMFLQHNWNILELPKAIACTICLTLTPKYSLSVKRLNVANRLYLSGWEAIKPCQTLKLLLLKNVRRVSGWSSYLNGTYFVTTSWEMAL